MKTDHLPEQPGVYKMFDKDRQIIYIGMSKNIHHRVQQHFQNKHPRAKHMMTQVYNIEYIVTSNVVEALLLEARSIKNYQPKYNTLLKDDKTFPYIVLDRASHAFPRVYQSRKQNSLQKSSYFGPFTNTTDVRNIVKTLQEAFLLRSCKDTFFQSRNRPCIEYEIKRCSAPCVQYISAVDYAKQVDQALNILKGNIKSVEKKLLNEMLEHSQQQQYESAAIVRDQIQSLLKINNVLHIKEKGHFIAKYVIEDKCCIQVIICAENEIANYQYILDDIFA